MNNLKFSLILSGLSNHQPSEAKKIITSAKKKPKWDVPVSFTWFKGREGGNSTVTRGGLYYFSFSVE
jgi:hypothetical protein